MNVEHRLVRALQQTGRVAPSPDLFARVVHSIEEDRQHRRRVIRAAIVLVLTAAAASVVVVTSLRDASAGTFVHRRTFEVLQLVVLTSVAVVLGPAIRRFGRGYAHDLFPATPVTGAALLRLLDVAYGLVVAGYILMTTELSAAGARVSGDLLAEQLSTAAARLGGLLLVLGVLHAATLVVLPAVALVHNSTRLGRALPRWLVVVLALAGIVIGWQVVSTLVGLAVMGAG